MQPIIDTVLGHLGTMASKFGMNILSYHQMLLEQFGQRATMAIYLCAIILTLIILFKVFKLAFNLLRFVIIPALVVAYVVSYFFPINFLGTLPVSGAAFSVLFLVKA